MHSIWYHKNKLFVIISNERTIICNIACHLAKYSNWECKPNTRESYGNKSNPMFSTQVWDKKIPGGLECIIADIIGQHTVNTRNIHFLINAMKYDIQRQNITHSAVGLAAVMRYMFFHMYHIQYIRDLKVVIHGKSFTVLNIRGWFYVITRAWHCRWTFESSYNFTNWNTVFH